MTDLSSKAGKEYFWCCAHAQLSTVKQQCQKRIFWLSPCCMHSAAAICQTCTFIWTYRAILAYGAMSILLIRLINSKFAYVKGFESILAIPIGLFMGVGWLGQQISNYLPNDYVMYAITLLGIWYYCFVSVPYKNPRKKVEVVTLWLCYLFLIGKAALPRSLSSGLSALAGLVSVIFMSFCLWYRNRTLEKRLLTEPIGRPPANSSDDCYVCKYKLASYILFPCLHSCYCYECASKLKNCLKCNAEVVLRKESPNYR